MVVKVIQEFMTAMMTMGLSQIIVGPITEEVYFKSELHFVTIGGGFVGTLVNPWNVEVMKLLSGLFPNGFSQNFMIVSEDCWEMTYQRRVSKIEFLICPYCICRMPSSCSFHSDLDTSRE